MKVRGLVTPRRLSEAAIAALASGDVDALLDIERAEFGGFLRMEKTDDDDDDDDKKDDDDTDDSGDGGKKKKKVKDDDDDSGADDDDDDDAALTAAQARMKAADKRAAAAEAELQKIRDKDKSELERAQGQVADLEKNVEDLQGEVTTLRLQNAFLSANDVTWHDPDTALQLAQSKKYLDGVVDDDGEVDKKAMKKALKRLGEEHKYLVKTDEKKDKDDEPDGPSGEPAGGRSDNSKDAKAKEAALRKRFPALR